MVFFSSNCPVIHDTIIVAAARGECILPEDHLVDSAGSYPQLLSSAIVFPDWSMCHS